MMMEGFPARWARAKMHQPFRIGIVWVVRLITNAAMSSRFGFYFWSEIFEGVAAIKRVLRNVGLFMVELLKVIHWNDH